jgi:cbb3-type cytochrome oxidase subunit 3
MEFENLQAIWDTQNEKPVFAMQDARLLVALYQQRERSRQRAFRLHFAPMYVAALCMLATIWGLIATFRNIDSLMRRFKGRFTHNGFAMSAWDYAGLAVAAGSLLAIVAPLYRERKKHERAQEIFAPSLRDELDRGLAQLDFEIRLDRAPRILRILILLSIAVVMIGWESQRAGGNPRPWWSALGVLWVFLPVGLVWAIGRLQGKLQKRERGLMRRLRLERRRALESMRAALDEDRSGVTTEIRKDS